MVLGLSGADTATISATTDNLDRAFHIGKHRDRPRFVAAAIASEQAIDDATDGAPDGMTRPQQGNQSHVS